MKYILIQNDGEIESNSFELIGASTKRGEAGKIGFFGSGLKYSIAYLMRNGIDFKVFSGNTELVFTTKKESLKDKQFERICINGIQTSYTTTMGPTWTEDWFVLREIYCNAIDETNCQLIKETEIVAPVEGKTRIYIQLTQHLNDIISNWDSFFSDERDTFFEVEKVYTSGLGRSDGAPDAYQAIKIFNKRSGIVYRRGIKVFNDNDYLYDYGLNHIEINEDRTAKSPFYMAYAFCHMARQLINEDWVKSILRTAMDDKTCKEYYYISDNRIDEPVSDKWIDFSKRYMLVVRELSGRFMEEIARSTKEVLYLPTRFARQLKEAIPEIQITGMGTVIGQGYLTIFERTSKISFLLNEVLRSLSEMKYEIIFEIIIAEFENDAVLGMADLQTKKIYLSRKVFDMGRREIAMTLMEENEHILSGQEDKTRAFQTHIFSMWLKNMEESNSLFL